MMKKNFFYVIRLQYLGFRYSGWQKQPGQRTIEDMLDKTFSFMFPNVSFKILGAGRTDAKVSSLNGAFELFIDQPILDCTIFEQDFNLNLPSDIRMLSIREVNADFNIIQDVNLKEYIYLFSFGKKAHPYSAAFLKNYQVELDLNSMKKAAALFEGEHDFSIYTSGLKKQTITRRTIKSCFIKKNELLTANFIPPASYALHVIGKGFMRYQIRMIMGALAQVGKHELSLEQITSSLQTGSQLKLTTIAPGSGLHLNNLEFK